MTTDNPISTDGFDHAREVLALFTQGPWAMQADSEDITVGPWTLLQAGTPIATCTSEPHARAIMELRYTLRHLLVAGERATIMLSAALARLDDTDRDEVLAADPGGDPPLSAEENDQLDDARDELLKMLGVTDHDDA